MDVVVMRQYRHKVSNEHCVDFGTWGSWVECKGIIHFNDIKSMIEDGYNYEVRELVVK